MNILKSILSNSEMHRSCVRILVTYIAAAFVFGGGGAMIVYALLNGKDDLAKDIFTAVLPVGTAIVTFWFAGRVHEKAAAKQNRQQPTENEQGSPQS